MSATATQPLPTWICRAGALPVAFAQVREDPELEATLLDDMGRDVGDVRALMIASGGCTVAHVVSRCRIARLDIVDTNPAQIALARVKVHLLRHFEPDDRLALLGHAPMPQDRREQILTRVLHAVGLTQNAIGPVALWRTHGPDYLGRYECVFARLQQQLRPHHVALDVLLSLRDPIEQLHRVLPTTTLGCAMDAAFDDAFPRSGLTHLFGDNATRNAVEPFARRFACRTRYALATMPAADNIFLWQLLAGRYPPGHYSPWLRAAAPVRMPHIVWNATSVTEALARAPQHTYDFIHLSNVLDWATETEASVMLRLAHAALRPGGQVLVRQLNSMLDVQGFDSGLTWDVERSRALVTAERAFFYRSVFVGTRP